MELSMYNNHIYYYKLGMSPNIKVFGVFHILVFLQNQDQVMLQLLQDFMKIQAQFSKGGKKIL